MQNWEEIESLKNEKSPGFLFSHFRENSDVASLHVVQIIRKKIV